VNGSTYSTTFSLAATVFFLLASSIGKGFGLGQSFSPSLVTIDLPQTSSSKSY